MSTFNDREQAFEKKFAHDEKLGFDVEARCSKLFGLWAASQMGMEGDAAKTYSMDVVNANLEEAGFSDILRKIRGDFEQNGVKVSEHMLEVELGKALEEAKRQILSQ